MSDLTSTGPTMPHEQRTIPQHLLLRTFQPSAGSALWKCSGNRAVSLAFFSGAQGIPTKKQVRPALPKLHLQLSVLLVIVWTDNFHNVLSPGGSLGTQIQEGSPEKGRAGSYISVKEPCLWAGELLVSSQVPGLM